MRSSSNALQDTHSSDIDSNMAPLHKPGGNENNHYFMFPLRDLAIVVHLCPVRGLCQLLRLLQEFPTLPSGSLACAAVLTELVVRVRYIWLFTFFNHWPSLPRVLGYGCLRGPFCNRFAEALFSSFLSNLEESVHGFRDRVEKSDFLSYNLIWGEEIGYCLLL